jgi:predicted GIY-YIG superfamily endonuclease
MCRRQLLHRIDQEGLGSAIVGAQQRIVVIVWAEHFPDTTDAISVEPQLKGWSRAKKEALIRGDFEAIRLLAKRNG